VTATICVAGLWHQGSVVSGCLADVGHRVRGVGPDAHVVAALRAGEPPVREPKLPTILRRNLRAGRLRYTTDYVEALAGAEFAYIAIDTPVDADDRSDLSSIFEAAREVGRAMSGDLVLCVTAQVPVGTCERLAAVVREQHPPGACEVVYVPEFLRLGTAVDTFRRADRFVIGAETRGVAERVANLYAPLARPALFTTLRSAEMAKHACNTFLAASISFINEIADLCDAVGADALEVARAMKLDRRIGRRAFLSPGLGFAGGTLGREVRALQQVGQDHNRATALMDATMSVNVTRARLVGQRLRTVYDSLAGLQVSVWGLTYKPGTSTLRRSVALEIIGDLVAQGATVRAFDPLANLGELTEAPRFTVCGDAYVAAQGCDALVLVTEWAGLRDLDLDRVRASMRRPVFVDPGNVLDPVEMGRSGFAYFGVGRRARAEAGSGVGR
jgi:UDPglucose 6-dehydrogenase